MVEPSDVDSHDDDAEVDDGTEDAELVLVDLVVVHDFVGAGGEDTVVQVDEDVGAHDEDEDPFGH